MKAEQQQQSIAPGSATFPSQMPRPPPVTEQAITTEAELLAKNQITPNDVLALPGITQGFLCSPSANVYNIEFTKFQIRDLDTEHVLFEIAKPENETEENLQAQAESARYVRYRFAPNFLKLKTVGATVEFKVGDVPITHFRMIERHFFKDRLLKCFDFEFGFCMPNSRNNCEHIYEFPQLSQQLMDDMINNPNETRSDSFYFVENKLVMHNKADYSYDA
ncbi:Protein unc-119 [Caenorhabditis elegans]|uniref:Protein unc-119 n=3 Tax=Caenorhabditis elegans TaxID=6239 RepID=UN119_CAEEL|nr:Protein unc-119 [Caenorhabditis elegans]Q10658.1 RecName: Full=Protein unc-119; AltName: Full=Uncoordinated protein 119 [Caenorhabditis elegans]AAT12434.1 UNC-119 [Cloning vector pWormgate2]ACM78589.1 UNC-119 [Expression vector pFJ1.1-yk1350a08]AAC46919.1 unc-119 [Caenorhabditis elegans]CAA97807.1 Protein unc-119 [Caenorhabditis elegans]|eukprot:NP_001255089.1 Protein unc-119 [Caenorhabditis elegans]